MIRPILTGALLVALASGWAIAVAAESSSASHGPAAAAVQPEYTLGEIRNIDLEQGVVTVKHAPIRHLGMPDMTMRFRLADPSRALSLRPGDVVRFRAEKRDGTLVITDVARR